MPQTPAPKRLSTDQAIGKALRYFRKLRDKTQEEAAEAAGVVVQSWRRYEWGQRSLSYDQIEDLARAIGASRAEVLEYASQVQGGPITLDASASEGGATVTRLPTLGSPPPGELMFLPIRDAVRAGAWLSVNDLDQTPPRVSTTVRDPRYPRANQWLAPVIGDSMNMRGVIDGDLVHLVDAIDISYEPLSGDIVEVARTRFQGSETELTLKEVEVTPEGVKLWPRSTNDAHKGPVLLTNGESDEEVEVRIRALMLQLIRRY